jgi:hypothetical protein
MLLFSFSLQAQKKVVGYIPTNFSPSQVDFKKITHLCLAFENPDAAGNLSYSGGNDAFVQAAHANNVKVMVSVCGGGASNDAVIRNRWFSLINSTNRAAFISKIVAYVNAHNLDGIDLDLEGAAINADYSPFAIALKNALPAGKLLVAALDHNNNGNLVTSTALQSLDFLNIMAYDRGWGQATHHSPYEYAELSAKWWVDNKAIPISKIIVGVPFYGYTNTTGNGGVTFNSILNSYGAAAANQDTWTANGNTIYYNGIPTIRRKTQLVLDQNYGGVMIWQLAQDATGTNSLLYHIDQVIKGACIAPAQPGAIAGAASVASGSSQTYSIASVATATSYTWTLPSGWSGNSTSTSITTTAGSAGGTISVRANNACGTSATRTLAVTVTCNAPAQPGAIAGNTTATAGSSQTYSVAAVSGATSYAWTLPSGWSGTSTSASITTTAGATGGTISVRANNACGSSAVRTLAVSIVVPTPNLALNKSVTVSSIEPGTTFAGANAVDGNLTTRWASNYVDPSWIYVDLAASYAVNRVKITWEAAYSTAYLVQVSTDAVNWQTIRTVTGNATLVNDWTGLIGTGRYVRVYSSARSSQWGNSIFELEVYGTSGCTVPAQPAAIAGNATVASGSSQTYSVAAVTNATSYTWTLPSGWSGTSISASINATAGATGGTISVRANNSCGSSAARTLAVTVTSPPVQTPYLGSAWSIPGRIDAENYDLGGQGIAFNDLTTANEGAAYRTDAVDIEATTGGYNIGWVAANEWLEYTVNVTAAGNYKIDARVAAMTAGQTFRIEMDGASIGTFTVPNTTGWQIWQTVTLNNIALTAGQKVMRIFALGGEFNLDNVIFTSIANIAPLVNITSPANNASFTAPANITITANASDSDGSVSKVEFFRGTDKIGEDATSPYSIIWTGAAAGTYSITAIATDDKNATKTSAAITVTVINSGPVQSPYGGTARAIPGTIQAEDYDLGGQGISFNDLSATNQGGAYRTDAVDVEANTDGGYNVAYALAGEWLEYTVNVTSAGTYKLDLRVAATTAGKTFHIEMDGVNISGVVTVPNTSGWDVWQTVSVNTISLTAGQKIMRVVFDSPDFNLNYLTFSAPPAMSAASTESIVTATNNPFSTSTTLGVVVNEPGEVSVKVYDLSGLLVRTIYEGYLNQSSYVFVLDGTGLKNDMYIIQCITPSSFSSIRVMKSE